MEPSLMIHFLVSNLFRPFFLSDFFTSFGFRSSGATASLPSTSLSPDGRLVDPSSEVSSSTDGDTGAPPNWFPLNLVRPLRGTTASHRSSSAPAEEADDDVADGGGGRGGAEPATGRTFDDGAPSDAPFDAPSDAPSNALPPGSSLVPLPPECRATCCPIGVVDVVVSRIDCCRYPLLPDEPIMEWPKAPSKSWALSLDSGEMGDEGSFASGCELDWSGGLRLRDPLVTLRALFFFPCLRLPPPPTPPPPPPLPPLLLLLS